MKHTLIKSLMISATALFSTLVFADDPLPMPVFEAPEAMTLEELRAEVPKLNRALGANPPTFFNVNHKNEVYKDWTKYLGAALIFQPTSKESATQKVHIMANLFVQGYHLDVEGTGEKAHQAIQFCLKVAPDSTECKLLSAMFYMSADSTKLDEIKQTLDALRAQFGKHKNADVEIALAYYYVYANLREEALKQIDIVEVFFDHLKKDNIKKYRLEQLREFKVVIMKESANSPKEMMDKSK